MTQARKLTTDGSAAGRRPRPRRSSCPRWGLFLLISFLSASSLLSSSRFVNVIRLENQVINPVTARYIQRAIKESEDDGAEALVLVLDTPGGLVSSMKDIVTNMANSRVPIIVYIAPRGAMAGSAGVFVTMVSHIAAMAPETSIGAAHVVSIEPSQSEPERGEKRGKSNQDILNEKMTNMLASMVKSIAKPRGRNVEWAENAVRKSITATADEALKLKVIEYVAPDLKDLLRRVDGKRVDVLGVKRKLQTASATVKEIPMTWSEKFLAIISHPQIAYILMSLGMLGLIYEFMNPGAILPGVVGVICLLLAMFALSMLPINYAGVGLLLLGVGLMIADVKMASHGALTTGGVIAFLLGSILLIQPGYPYLRVPWTVIIPMVAVITSFFAFLVGAGLRAQKVRVATGHEGMLGMIGKARTPLNPEGRVFVNGEFWNARAEDAVGEGESIVVVGVEGLNLRVKRKENS